MMKNTEIVIFQNLINKNKSFDFVKIVSFTNEMTANQLTTASFNRY